MLVDEKILQIDSLEGWNLETFLRDLRYSARRLIQSPGITVLAVLSLALGIGINTAIFSYLNFALLRPLPVESPEELIRVYTATPDFEFGAHSYGQFRDLQESGLAFDDVLAERFTEFNLATDGGDLEQVWGMLVSGNYFTALGLQPAAGRLLSASDDVSPGGHPLAVLSYDTWQRRFGGSDGAVGQRVRINGYPFTVLGVAPSAFTGTTVGLVPEVWVPMAMQETAIPGGNRLEDRSRRWLSVIGRLAPDTSLTEAESALGAFASRLAEQNPDTDKSLSYNLLPLAEDNLPFQFHDKARLLLGLLMGVAALVLLIACANLANLLLARAATRRTEVSLRLAVGASRVALVRQLLIESLLLALIAGIAGLVLGSWVMRILGSLDLPTGLPFETAVALDLRVLAFTMLVSLVAGVLFGLAPALNAVRTDLVPALKREEPMNGRRLLPLRSVLVVGQVALCLVLLIAAGLFVRSLRNTLDIDPGFDTEHMLIGQLQLGLAGYDEDRGRALYRQLSERLEAQPGIRGVSLADGLPLDAAGSQQIRMEIPGYEPLPDEGDPVIDFNVVGADYFATMDIPLLEGRDFRLQDAPEPWLSIVNQALAERFWPGESALGKRMLVAGAIPVDVVGVVEDHSFASLNAAPEPFLYLSAFQHYQSSMHLQVRTEGDPLAILPVVRRELRNLDPELPLGNVTTMDSHVMGTLLPLRLSAMLLASFGILALVLAVVGIYGVMTYAVRRRTRELGIRMAIGADRGHILGLVLRQGLLLVGIGAGLGLLVALWSTRFLSSFLVDITSTDPVTFVVVPILFLFVGMLASLVPATRASRTEPMTILRRE